MRREAKINEQAHQFRSLAELTWTKNTIYPRSKEHFRTFNPEGQCGVTNFGFGVWLVWRGLARPNQMLYAEGRVHDSEDRLIDNKHAWLMYRRSFARLLGHVDLALDQYPGVSQEVVTKFIIETESGDHPAQYCVDVQDNACPRQMTCVKYTPDAVTPLEDYDAANFKGRLETFLGSCYNSTAFMGQQAIKGTLEDIWLPSNSMQTAEHQSEVLATKPCDAQLFTSI